MTKKSQNKPKKEHLPKAIKEEMREYVTKLISPDYFSVEDIIDMVQRKYGRKISRAMYYRLTKNKSNGK
mgnify:CR=1 FL=1